MSGQQLAARAQVQAQKFGARIGVPRAVHRLQIGEPFTIALVNRRARQHADGGDRHGRRYRRLAHLPELDRYEGSGVHYAATAVEAGLCEGEEIVVVGGGNSAGQAACSWLVTRATCTS